MIWKAWKFSNISITWSNATYGTWIHKKKHLFLHLFHCGPNLLQQEPIHRFMVQSCWKGNYISWPYQDCMVIEISWIKIYLCVLQNNMKDPWQVVGHVVTVENFTCSIPKAKMIPCVLPFFVIFDGLQKQ